MILDKPQASYAFRLAHSFIALVVLCSAVTSAALTLARSNDVPLIGRLLDVSIPVALAGALQSDELCPEADVFMGEGRVDATLVTVRVEPSVGGNAVVRIRTLRPVDEPVVTIQLRLHCTQKITQRYVLLSEQPPKIGLPVTGLTHVPVPASPSVGSPGRGKTSDSQEQAVATSSRTTATSRAERALRQRASTHGGVNSRLKVDRLETVPAREPNLRSSLGLVTVPTNYEAVRAQVDSLPSALDAQSADLLRDLQRVQALENDLKEVRRMVATNDGTLQELREELNPVHQHRTLTLAVIALLLLLLSAAGVVIWWSRPGERSLSSKSWRGRGAVLPKMS